MKTAIRILAIGCRLTYSGLIAGSSPACQFRNTNLSPDPASGIVKSHSVNYLRPTAASGFAHSAAVSQPNLCAPLQTNPGLP